MVSIEERRAWPKSNFLAVDRSMYDSDGAAPIRDTDLPTRGEIELTAVKHLYIHPATSQPGVLRRRWKDAATFGPSLEPNLLPVGIGNPTLL